MLWGILVSILGVVAFNFIFIPPVKIVGEEKPTAINLRPESLTVETANPKYDAFGMIMFTKKVACRHNVQVIDTMVEMWYLQHDGEWPRDDLSDIGRDKKYFNKGIPVCPVTGEPYVLDPETKRVKGHIHGDIKDFTEEDFIDKNIPELPQ